jgi:hypothetical protein
MAYLQIVNGGDSLHIQSVDVNMLNKQSQTADWVDPPARGLGRELTTPLPKKNSMLQNVT